VPRSQKQILLSKADYSTLGKSSVEPGRRSLRRPTPANLSLCSLLARRRMWQQNATEAERSHEYAA
jgi:hypothetical protein